MNVDYKRKRVDICGGVWEFNAQVYYNNSTRNFEISIGPIMDSNGNPMEKVYVSIEFNGTIFYNITNSMGFTKIIIPEKSVSIEELNTEKTVICKAEGYEDLIFDINLKYP
jgi:hypothetical protein